MVVSDEGHSSRAAVKGPGCKQKDLHLRAKPFADRKKGCLGTTIATDYSATGGLVVSAITTFAVKYDHYCRRENAEKAVSQEICSGSRSLQG